MLARLLAALAPALFFCVACGSASDDASASQSDLVKPALAVDDVNAAIATLRAQREGDPIGPYYADGNRLEGCWRNPAGAKLTDLKKAFYCSMPLEFRLCNTVVLLTTDESKVEERYAGYLSCQRKVDAVFGGTGLFVYDPKINAIYRTLYLEGSPLPAADTADVVAANKPPFTDRPFPVVLAAIGAGLTQEALDLSADALRSMVDDFLTAGGEAR
jgi:hypothetical protein